MQNGATRVWHLPLWGYFLGRWGCAVARGGMVGERSMSMGSVRLSPCFLFS